MEPFRKYITTLYMNLKLNNMSRTNQNYSRNEIEEMKDFTREKLYIEHVLPETIKQEGKTRRLKALLYGSLAGIAIGKIYTYFLKKKQLEILLKEQEKDK